LQLVGYVNQKKSCRVVKTTGGFMISNIPVNDYPPEWDDKESDMNEAEYNRRRFLGEWD